MKKVLAQVKQSMVCSNCGEEIYKCHKCEDTFSEHDLVCCSDNYTENYHYHGNCYPWRETLK